MTQRKKRTKESKSAESESAVYETDDSVLDESEREEYTHSRFKITSYGADMTAFELAHRLGKDLIVPPAFQRKYVWRVKQASRFIESLLMGLPVPGIFLFKDQKIKKQLLVDGLQRLETVHRFKNKRFEGKLFKLTEVAEPWNGKTWDELVPEDQDTIDQSVIHATIFQQDFPKERDRSIYEVFERINTGGIRLSPQEIRACISFGGFSTLLRELNGDTKWREIFGKPSNRLKDEELILRFFALLHDGTKYTKPMRDFLDDFLERNRELQTIKSATLSNEFASTVTMVREALGARAFRLGATLNAAIFDAVMVGVAERLQKGPIRKPKELASAYERLLKDKDFISAYVRATSDEESVRSRLQLAGKAFANVS
jgi:hypothetical protein